MNVNTRYWKDGILAEALSGGRSAREALIKNLGASDKVAEVTDVDTRTLPRTKTEAMRATFPDAKVVDLSELPPKGVYSPDQEAAFEALTRIMNPADAQKELTILLHEARARY